MVKDKDYKPNPAIIEDNCRIGSNVKIKPGVVIKEGTVIGMNSLITKDTDGGLWFGMPARKIK